MAGAGKPLVCGEGRLVCGASGSHDEAAEPGCTRGPRRQRSGAAAHRDAGTDCARDLDLAVEQHGSVPIRLRYRKQNHLDCARRKLEPQLARRILQYGPQLDQLRDERSQPAVGGQPVYRKRHGHARARPRARSGFVPDVQVRVRVVTCRREEPRLNPSSFPDALDPPCPCASQTSRRPRPNRPRCPPYSGSSPRAPRRRSTVAASTPTPSSTQLASKRQARRAGTRRARFWLDGAVLSDVAGDAA
jgi:hypothetical protein